jgi:hypothetical protein
MKRKIVKKRNRSGKFPCDVCSEIGYLEEHHINGRKIKDYNKTWNVCNICPNCHRKVHEGDIIIEQWAYSTSGKFLSWHYSNEKGDFPNAETYLI